MKTDPITTADLAGVIAVPPLARRRGAQRAFDFAENTRLLEHMVGGGITRFLYGGNAFLHHLSLAEYGELLEWLTDRPADWWMIPSAGPSFGRLVDQASLLKRHHFPAVMTLPCGDPRDARGLERGLREFADTAATPLILYLKEEGTFGNDRFAGLDAVARLVDDGICVGIKYAVVRDNPSDDPYLASLLDRVSSERVVSGIGERPAVVHMEEWRLPGFTTGSGCIQPRLSHAVHEACSAGDFDSARLHRESFLPLEDLRDSWGPAPVLHHAVELAGVALTGPIPPFVSELDPSRLARLAPVSLDLLGAVPHSALS